MRDNERPATAAPTRGRRVGRPSVSEADALEQDVLAAALAEFRSHGLSGASIERIAGAASVTRSAIYRRYSDKRGLFDTVLQAEIVKLRERAEQVIQASDDPIARLRDTALAYCRFVLSPVALDLQRIVISEAARTAGATRISAVPPELASQIETLVAAAQAAGALRPGPPDLWRIALIRLVAEGPRWDALASGAPWSEKRLGEDFARMWAVFLAVAAAAPERG